MYKVLPLVRHTLNEFHSLEIDYCHFKSNEHIGPAVSGLTDLDILFAYEEYDRVNSLLLKLGFQKCHTAWFVSYPYVEDYIAINEGKIIHIHAHFKLILGESKVKSYVLPWGDKILKSKIFLKEYNIFTSHPIHEMLLLIIRTALKLPLTNFDYGKKRDIVDANREFNWLKTRVEKKEIMDYSSSIFDKKIESCVATIYDNNINYNNVKNFYKYAKTTLSSYRRYNYVQSKIIKQLRRFAIVLVLINRKFKIHQGIRMHRTLGHNKGVIITLMGADGSGKSTQVKRIKDIMSKKLDVRYIYMGSGNGPASWHRNILKFAGSFLNKKKEVPSTKKKRLKFSIKSILTVIYLVSLAVEKRSKLKKLAKYREKGMFCITDRYPQNQTFGYNDSLHMGDWLDSSNLILKSLARFERKCYAFSEIITPNLVVKLIGGVDLLHSRRQEMTKEEITIKQNGIRSTKFNALVKVIELDAALEKEVLTTLILNHTAPLLTNQKK